MADEKSEEKKEDVRVEPSSVLGFDCNPEDLSKDAKFQVMLSIDKMPFAQAFGILCYGAIRSLEDFYAKREAARQRNKVQVLKPGVMQRTRSFLSKL